MSYNNAKVVQRYVEHALQYLENGLIALQKGEAGKAGELLWGSVAEAAHGLAATKNVPLRSHRDLMNFVIGVSKELNDKSLADDLMMAQDLHHNYYEVELNPGDIEIVLPRIRALVTKLLEFIPPEAVSEVSPAQP